MLRITIIIIITLNIFVTTGFSQSVYDVSFQDIHEDSISISRYAGKKIMVILVPFSQQDTVYKQLTTFKARYGDSVQVIGVVSLEDGFQTRQATVLSALYNDTGIILTGGMHTRKATGNEQSPLLQWLTDKTKNHHYEVDTVRIGYKFFITESGRLFAVLTPSTSLQSFIINRIVHSNPQ
jgi:glutathione peroxidase-family protein